MRKYVRRAVTGVAAALVLATAVTVASANHFSVSNQQIRIVHTPLTFVSSGAATIECNVTLEGSFSSATSSKVLGTLSGRITRATLGHPCRGGSAWIYNGEERNETLGSTALSNSLPWHVTYEGFTGVLPRIETTRLLSIGVHWLLRATILGVPSLCNYTTTTTEPLESIETLEAAGGVTELRSDETKRIRAETGGTCPTGSFQGSGPVTQLGTTNRIIIRLI